MAVRNSGRFLLRIEDIDQNRARMEWEDRIYDDLTWLGISWEKPVMRQSQRMNFYRDALAGLWARGLLYPCFCNRRDILQAVSAPQEGAPLTGPDGLIYPGICHGRARDPCAPLPDNTALRLDLRAAIALLPPRMSFTETGRSGATEQIHFRPEELSSRIGDIVLCRRDMGTSYHLSVVLDDADQDITNVVRGEDLFEATIIHVVLQHLLDLPTPVYHHHRLIRDAGGKRLAKRDDARAIALFRSEGAAPKDIRRLVGL